MSATSSYTLGGVTVDGTTFATQSARMDLGVESGRVGHSGSASPTYNAVQEQNAQFDFSTHDLWTALNAIGFDGKDAAGAELWLQKLLHAGFRSSGTDHAKMTVTQGYLIPVTLQAQGAQWATLECQIWVASTDGNDPLSFSTVTLPTPAASMDAFVAGGCEINGNEIQVQQLTVEFGIEVHARRHDGNVWPGLLAGMDCAPRIRITTDDVRQLSLGTNGIALTGSGCEVWFRKVNQNGTRVATTVAEHLHIKAVDGMAMANETSANQGGEASYEIVVEPTYDGTNDILQIAQAAMETA